MKAITLTFAVLMVCSASSSAGQGPAWAWEAGKITNNGSVQIKSTNGTSTYNAVQNPTGAVAKTNQSAVTQPPTVIIQSTSGGYVETVALLVAAPTPPSCPSGYTRIYAVTGNTCPGMPGGPAQVFNVGGTRWSLVATLQSFNNNVYLASWMADNAPIYYAPGGTANTNTTNANGNPSGPMQLCSAYGTTNYQWSASLCSK